MSDTEQAPNQVHLTPEEVYGHLPDPNIFIPPTEPIDDSGKTAEQILAEIGVTQQELDRTFPETHTFLDKHPATMKREELLVRAKETAERLKDHTSVKNPDSLESPNEQALCEKYAQEQEEVLNKFPHLKDILEKLEQSKTATNQTAVDVRKVIIDDIKQSVKAITEVADFDAKAARKIWMNKIGEKSRLTGLLLAIKREAGLGRSSFIFEYITVYDKIKLQELGFTVIKQAGQQPMSYTVSWE